MKDQKIAGRLEQFDREEQERLNGEFLRDGGREGLQFNTKELSIISAFIKSHDSKRAEIVAREAVEERLETVKRDIFNLAMSDPSYGMIRCDDIMKLPSLQLPASDSDTTI